MGDTLSQPVKDKHSLSLEDDRLQVGVSCMQGWRASMEDAHTIAMNVPPRAGATDAKDSSLFCVFDGHCGDRVAQCAAANVVKWLTSSENWHTNGDCRAALYDAHVNGDHSMRVLLPRENSGATAVSVLVADKTVYCANTGDSRAVLCRGGRAIPLSFDHKPTNPNEQRRIVRAGGFVSAEGRVNGNLALSRALGDYSFKANPNMPPEEQAVTCVPDLIVEPIGVEDEFVVVACDGIWDCMTNPQVIAFVRKALKQGTEPSVVCEQLMDACLSRTCPGLGCDNMSVVVVVFKPEYTGASGLSS